MRYTGIQPQYFPRLHYFARILNADLFVIRDDCQFVRKHKYPGNRVDKSYQADTPIKQAFNIQLMSFPVQHDGFSALSATKIFYGNTWVNDHLKALTIGYSKAPRFKEIYPEIKQLLTLDYMSVADLNAATIFWGIKRLLNGTKARSANLTLIGINKLLKTQKKVRLQQIHLASKSHTLKNAHNLSATEKIIKLCQEFGGDEDYCGGTGAAAYMEHELFKQHGIKTTIQDWKCPVYPQLFMKQQGFIPNLSIIDLLMNVPAAEALRILT